MFFNGLLFLLDGIVRIVVFLALYGWTGLSAVGTQSQATRASGEIVTTGRGFYPQKWYFHLTLHAGALPLSAAGRSGSLSPSIEPVRA